MPWIQIKVIALCGMIKCKEYVEAVDFYSKNPEMETNTVAVDAIIRLLADQDFLENLRNCEEVFAVPWRVFIKIICSSERNRGFAIDNRLVHTVYLIMSSKFACQDSEYFSPDVFNSALEWLGKNLRSEDFYSLTRNIHISLKLGYLDRALQYYNAIISNDGHGENRNLFAINRLLISSLATNDINTKNISSTLGSNIPTLDSFPTSHEFITKNVPPSQYDMAYLTLAKILINATNDPNVRLYSIMNFIRTMRNTKSGFHRNVPPRALYNMAFSLILETKKFAEADIIHRWLIDDEHKRLHRKPFSRNTKMLIEKILKH
ncbi:hypothetical protein H4219_001571 [Mycoemilia scoparia]|uniref:Uncharacterized protein n=1 Tax=Mycoemilia scoparia TaxID=417184 RepID=A0A9W8A6A5_9FUNG|nr:hypothetical protein H4219_001571 [Mycoemilia scoparia]